MVLVIDNYDSFTFNLVQMLGALGAAPRVIRNDAYDVEGIRGLSPTHVVVSPGPCTPSEAGVSVDVFRALGGEVPLLGVCLGHQSLGEAYGGRTVRARQAMHGKTGSIEHDGGGLFAGLPSPLTVARYHSLVTDADVLPEVLKPTAWSREIDGHREIQAMRHVDHPSWGVQFHPESLFSEGGVRLLENFLRL
jgi:anthranilate synthase/aminodeoxychorismate synthase-like glutamine amidotransferase